MVLEVIGGVFRIVVDVKVFYSVAVEIQEHVPSLRQGEFDVAVPFVLLSWQKIEFQLPCTIVL